LGRRTLDGRHRAFGARLSGTVHNANGLTKARLELAQLYMLMGSEIAGLRLLDTVSMVEG